MILWITCLWMQSDANEEIGCAPGELGRKVLPVLDAKYVGLATYDVKGSNTNCPPVMPLRPPSNWF